MVKPRDFSRLLANFQASLQEITIIATEPAATPYTEASAGTEAKAVEMRSFVDRTKGEEAERMVESCWEIRHWSRLREELGRPDTV